MMNKMTRRTFLKGIAAVTGLAALSEFFVRGVEAASIPKSIPIPVQSLMDQMGTCRMEASDKRDLSAFVTLATQN